jgi:outer membrane lipoprotein-sorting protein
MKKLFLCVLLLLTIVSCKGNEKNYIEELTEFNSSLTKYNLKAQMTVVKEEGNISFDVEVDYLEPDYYKVKMKNNKNNNIQIIVKNKDGVFVLTPALNKQFKFNSDWPLNSSHAYLIQSIVKDISNDSESLVETDDSTYSITSLTDFKSNGKVKFQTAKFDKKTNYPISNIVCDALKNPLIKVEFNSFNPNVNLKPTDFKVDVVNNTARIEMSEGTITSDLTECVPTFMPEGYELKASTIKENYTVFTYIKEENSYVITCNVIEESDVLTVTREYDDMVITDQGICFLNTNSLSFFVNDLLVSIYQNDMVLEEAIQIANSFELNFN